MGVRARPLAWWELASVSRADRITEGAAKASSARRAYAEACIAARRFLSSGDAASAVTTLEPVVADAASAIDAHRLLGIGLLEVGDSARARRPFEVALEGDPFDIVAQVGLAEVEEATEGPAVAFRAWRRAWEMEPGFEPVAVRLREIRRVQLAEGSATSPFTTDGSVDGPIAHTHSSLARARLRAGLHHHAMLDAMEALRQDRSRVDIQLLLAEAWWRSGETEIAHDVAASILEVNPNCVGANLLVAVHRRAVSRDPRQQVERARQADPFDRIAHQLFAGRDIPPIMEDAWNGDQWSASRASYGEWPLVAVMPRAVAVVRAQLAAEKAAAEAAERARIEAEAEARRRKAAEEAAKKPAAGAFKGTGVISDTPPKPTTGKGEGADAASPPAKPAGFKGSGVIAAEEPTFKSKSRRPAGAEPVAAASATPNAEPEKPVSSPDQAALASTPATSQPPTSTPGAELPPGSPGDAPLEASANSLESADDSTVPETPSPAPAIEQVTGATRPDPLGSASSESSGPDSEALATAPVPTVTNGNVAFGSAPSTTAVPRIVHSEFGPEREVASLNLGPQANVSARSPMAPPPRALHGDAVGQGDRDQLRVAADAAFRERRFTDAVRAYAALLRES